MKHSCKHRVMWGAAVLCGVLAMSAVPYRAGAIILGGVVTDGTAHDAGGIFVKLAAPLTNPHGTANSVGKDNYDSPNLFGFDEGKTLLPHAVHGDIGQGTVPANVYVESHYIFFDPGARQTIKGTVDFDSNIISVIVSTRRLDLTDFLSTVGVNYVRSANRGIEHGDSVTISGARQITVKLSAQSPGDYIRVITRASVAHSQAVRVEGDSNPWLAGMPDGTQADQGDVAPKQSPKLVHISTSSQTLQIASAGRVSYTGLKANLSGPEGLFAIAHAAGAEYSKSELTAPINSLIGVFLDENVPSGTPPAGLDFSSAASRDFLSISPMLNQPFFIGNGLNSVNVFQTIHPPIGATRLYLGTMDGFGWFNNSGAFTVIVNFAPF